MTHAPDNFAPRFTYRDYAQWDGDERWELIDGAAWCMSPSPGVAHQRALGRLFRRLSAHFSGGPCEVLLAPLDVRLPEAGEQDDQVRTVVQPDLMVVCDPAKIDAKGVRGAPDLVVEILSPSTAGRDSVAKAALYEHHGVREYWIVDADGGRLLVQALGPEGRWTIRQEFGPGSPARSTVFPGLEVDLAAVMA